MTNQLRSIPPRYLLYAAFRQSKQSFIFKNLFSSCLILLLYLVVGKDLAWGQTLGGYPSSTVRMGQNTSITPSAAPSNATSIVAYCTNTNFKGGLTANPTTGVVRVTAAQQAGTYTVTVKAFGTATTTTTFDLTVTDPACSQAGLVSSTSVSVGSYPTGVAIGDFNEDGHQDLAVANVNSSTVSIRLGNGQGGFSSATDVSVGTQPRAVAIGDFNGDGHQDLAVVIAGGPYVSIRLGDGQGGFSGTTNVSVASGLYAVAIGDFNGDGKQDLATANSSANTVSIRLGDGQGGFSVETDVSAGSAPWAVAIGDFDGDGDQDLAVANYFSSAVSIRLGDGQGGFSGTTVVSVGSQPSVVSIGDFNGDGNQDLAVANSGGSTASIRLGNGDGTFSGTTDVSVGSQPWTVAIGDFNGDGDQDFATTNNGAVTVSIRLGNGNGGFSGTSNVSVGSNPFGLVIGDFNRDGHQDFAAANSISSGTVSIQLGSGPEINVQGNNTDIADGDSSPSSADDTDFGTASGLITRTFTIQNTGNAALAISSISSSDPAFVVSGAPSSVAAGSSASFDVAFTPNGDPVQNATITINSDDCNKGVYDFVVKWSLLVPCNSVLSSLNVTLDGNGQFSLTPQTVAAGPCTYANYRVVVQDNNQSNGEIIDCAGTWTYGLFDADGHLVAWGKVTAEDKTAPLLVSTDFYQGTLDCYDVNYVLNNPKTIGTVGETVSPKAAATSTQTILYGEAPNTNTAADDIKNLGYPNFQDNCKSCGCRVTLKWSDKVVYYGCDSISATGIYARIFREWVATDCNGMRSSVVQVIPFARPEVVLADPCAAKPATTKQLVFRGDGKCGDDASVAAPNYDWVVQYTSCTPDKSLIKKVDVMPSFRSYFYNDVTKRDIYLDEVECNYSVQIKDTEFPTCGGKGLKISREIFVFDWCAGGVIDTLHVLIKITDDKAPTLTAPVFTNGAPYRNPAQLPMVEISTGPMDCTAAIPTSVVGIKKTFGYTIADNCTLGNVTVSVKTKDRYVKGILVAENTWDKVDYAIMNNTMIGLPTGVHRLIIDMSDGCYNASRDSFDFYVYDGIAPVMKCDDQLNVSLSNGNGYTTGYAQVRVEDLNEGSWDNCKLAWIKARRNVPAALVASFIAKGYDSNNNGKLDAAVGNDINADGDYNDVINGVEEVLKDGADGIDINGDGDFADFGETFVLKGGKLMTPLTDAVEFYCGDVAAKVVVELWGSDNAYGNNGYIEGNRGFCWQEILVEDKIAPICVAPFDLTVDCDEKCLEKIDNKAVSALCFGDVTITSGNDCAAMDTVYTVVKSLKCGYGTIIRNWALTKQTAKGPITINCAQTITVLPRHNYNITFPKDAITNCKQPIVDTVIVDELDCDILAVNVLDKRYDASNDECYKIFRTYTVINWCTFSDECADAADLGDGSSDHTNAYVVDRGTFGNYGKAALNVLVRDKGRNNPNVGGEIYLSKDLKVDTTGNPNTDDVKSTFYDELSLCDETGDYYQVFQYTQIIKVYDDLRPIVTGDAAKFCIRDGADCKANLKMMINGTDNCSDAVTLETQFLMIAPNQTLDASKMLMFDTKTWSTKDLGNGNFEINVKDLAALGTHDLIVVVRDECGNLSVPTRIPFTIADCKGPAPICINGLSVDLMPDGAGAGMMTVWATDFVASKVYDCNGQGPETKDGLKLVTKYSVNRVKEPVVANQTSISVNCADLELGFILVELHAWDEVGNHDFCVTYVEVQDNRKVCPGATTGGSFNIAGTIATEGAAKLQGASISLSGAASQTATTTANGAYAFDSMAKGGDFTISPQLDKNHLNGVSTFDLVLIQKHILNVQALNSPYKMIAADVNNSKSITTLDLIALRKLILNIDQSFQNNTSWRFVDATYQFPNASNPWAAAFPEVVSINDLGANTTANFVAIKVGDVNASATVSAATAAEVRTKGTLEINATEAALKAGQEYSVKFSAADLKNVQGYQFALNLDKRKVELVDIVYGVAKAENFGVFASEGIITTSWNQAGFATATAKQGALFTLVLRAKADAQLSSALSLNRIVAPEAYNSNNDQLNLALKFNGAAVSNGFELKQNTPNPFNGETVIKFNLPKATAATLTIRDVTGRILKSVRSTYAKGLNQVSLKASDLNASGVLYYTLEADDFTATKKMILLSE
jgi:large repetitive protein